MDNTILQIPIKKNIRDKASAEATKMGFSSLQEVVRIFLNKMALGELDIKFKETVTLSQKNDTRYSKMIEDIRSGKVDTKSFSDTESLMEYLKSEH